MMSQTTFQSPHEQPPGNSLVTDSGEDSEDNCVAGWIVRWRRLFLTGLCVYWGLAFAATHVPMPEVPSAPSHTDKLVHFTIYFGLAVGLMVVLSTSRPRVEFLGLRTLVICIGYAAIDELTQIPIPSRSGDWLDFLTDAAGVLAGVGFASAMRRRCPDWWATG